MKFAITFQQRFSDSDVHPVLSEVTGQSYLVVEAPSELKARAFLYKYIDNNYAFIYDYDADFLRQIRQYNLTPVVCAINTERLDLS